MAARRAIAPVLLGLAVATYAAVFGWLTWQQQTNYGTFGYDMGLHDQGIWLLSQFERPFVTIRGMHYLGHHVNLVSLFYVPFYWLGAGPHLLYLTETLVLASAAVPVWLLARDRLAGPGADLWALVPATAYLLHPSVQWMNWWHWHPETLAIAPLLWAWWFASRRRWVAFAVAVGLALSTKEDVALAVLMLGVVLGVVGRQRRAGVLTFAAGLFWFLLCTRVVIPALLGGIPFYEQQLFPEFGDSLGSVLVGMATDPTTVYEMATSPDRLTYYWKLLAPLGFLPLLAFPFILIAGPQLGVNVLSALPGTHDIRFQYSAVVIAALLIAAVEALGWMHGRRRRLAHVAAVVMLIGAIAGNVAWSPSPLGREYDSGIWAKRIPRHDAFDRAVELVPDDAGVSASYGLIPHLTHRKHAYEWPNPWLLGNWGLDHEDPPDPADADYLVIDLTLDQHPGLLAALTGPDGDYRILFEEDGVLVAVRRPGR